LPPTRWPMCRHRPARRGWRQRSWQRRELSEQSGSSGSEGQSGDDSDDDDAEDEGEDGDNGKEGGEDPGVALVWKSTCVHCHTELVEHHCAVVLSSCNNSRAAKGFEPLPRTPRSMLGHALPFHTEISNSDTAKHHSLAAMHNQSPVARAHSLPLPALNQAARAPSQHQHTARLLCSQCLCSQ
jgi:hypothetical protein